MNKYICWLFLTIVVFPCTAQFNVEGLIKQSAEGTAVYIFIVNDPKQPDSLVQVCYVDKTGVFFCFVPSFPTGSLFKAKIFRDGKWLNPLKDEALDNSCLFTNEQLKNIRLETISDSCFYKARYRIGPGSNKEFEKLGKLKLPLYQLMSKALTTVQSNPIDQQQFYTVFSAAINTYRANLIHFFEKTPSPAAAAACLYALNITAIASIDTAQLNQHIDAKKLPATSLTNALLNPYSQRNSNIGKRIGELTLYDLINEPITIATLIQKTPLAVIDCWASWCMHCRKINQTKLPAFVKRLEKAGIPFISVSIDTDVKPWKQAVVKDKISWQQFIDMERRSFFNTLNIKGIPHYIVIDASSKVIFETNSFPILNDFITQQLTGK